MCDVEEQIHCRKYLAHWERSWEMKVWSVLEDERKLTTGHEREFAVEMSGWLLSLGLVMVQQSGEMFYLLEFPPPLPLCLIVF